MPSDSSLPGDASYADMVAESLMPGRKDAVRRLFNAQGAPAPTIIWAPEPTELPNAQMRRFAQIMDGWRDENGHVPAAQFDLAAFDGLRDWIMLVKPDGDDFEYTYYGAGIINHYGRDLTGHHASDIGGYISQFFTGVYRAAIARGEWVMSEHEPPEAVFVRSWRRVIVPMYDDDQNVSLFAALNLPENELRAGLELMPDPVFVIAPSLDVQYANRSAIRMFGLNPTRQRGETLLDLRWNGVPLTVHLPMFHTILLWMRH